jgi:Fe-S-cluster-containing hydrogenase component 2
VAKYRIEVNPERCTSCLRCQLACSERHTGAFNPSAARIRVVLENADCSISFTPECTGCGICAEQCLYDALVKTRQRVSS